MVPIDSQNCFLGSLILLVAYLTKLERLLVSMRWYAASAASVKASGWVDLRASSTVRFLTAGLIFNSLDAPGVRNRATTKSTSFRRGWIEEPTEYRAVKSV